MVENEASHWCDPDQLYTVEVPHGYILILRMKPSLWHYYYFYCFFLLNNFFFRIRYTGSFLYAQLFLQNISNTAEAKS